MDPSECPVATFRSVRTLRDCTSRFCELIASGELKTTSRWMCVGEGDTWEQNRRAHARVEHDIGSDCEEEPSVQIDREV